MMGVIADSVLGVIYCEPKRENTATEGAAQGAKALSEHEDTARVARSTSVH